MFPGPCTEDARCARRSAGLLGGHRPFACDCTASSASADGQLRCRRSTTLARSPWQRALSGADFAEVNWPVSPSMDGGSSGSSIASLARGRAAFSDADAAGRMHARQCADTRRIGARRHRSFRVTSAAATGGPGGGSSQSLCALIAKLHVLTEPVLVRGEARNHGVPSAPGKEQWALAAREHWHADHSRGCECTVFTESDSANPSLSKFRRVSGIERECVAFSRLLRGLSLRT